MILHWRSFRNSNLLNGPKVRPYAEALSDATPLKGPFITAHAIFSSVIDSPVCNVTLLPILNRGLVFRRNIDV